MKLREVITPPGRSGSQGTTAFLLYHGELKKLRDNSLEGNF